jgi:hypothetical protein
METVPEERRVINYTNEKLPEMQRVKGQSEVAQDGQEEERPKPKLLPMTPLAASATVINLVLATGPFR